MRKLKFFVKAFLISAGVTLLWAVSHYVVPFSDAFEVDVNIMTSGTITTLGIFYALASAFVLSTVWEQFLHVQDSVRLRDKRAFLKNKDKRIPLPIKILLFLFSAMLLGAVVLLPFHSVVNGIYSVFTISLGICLSWAVIMDLDDPFEGVWNVEIPKEWKKYKNTIHIKDMLKEEWEDLLKENGER